MDRENAAGNFRCSTLSEDSLTAIALALHLNYESHSGVRARNISALKNLLLRIRDCLVSSASSSHGSYSSSVEPNGNGIAARYKYTSMYKWEERWSAAEERGKDGKREGRREGPPRTRGLRFLLRIICRRRRRRRRRPSGSYVAVRWTLTTGDAVQRRRVRSPR